MSPREEILFYICYEMGEVRYGKKTEDICILFKTGFVSEDDNISESNRKGEVIFKNNNIKIIMTKDSS